MRRAAKWGTTTRSNSVMMSAFSGTRRERSTEPMIVCRLTISRARLSSALSPPIRPITTRRPPGAMAFRLPFR